MSLVVKNKVKEIVHAQGKRMSKEAWVALDARIMGIINGAIKQCGTFKTIKDTEILTSARTSA